MTATDYYIASQVPGTETWMVKWFKPELYGDYVEALITGNFQNEQQAIDAAKERNSWA